MSIYNSPFRHYSLADILKYIHFTFEHPHAIGKIALLLNCKNYVSYFINTIFILLYSILLAPTGKRLERQDLFDLMASMMMNQAGTLTPSELERIKWTENEIQLNNLTSANSSQFMIDVIFLLLIHNVI